MLIAKINQFIGESSCKRLTFFFVAKAFTLPYDWNVVSIADIEKTSKMDTP